MSISMTMLLFVTTLTIVTALPMIENSTEANYKNHTETIAPSFTPQESVNTTTFSFASGNYSDEAVASSSNTTSAPWMSVNLTTLSSTSGNYSVKNVTGTTEKPFNSSTPASATANYSSVLLNSTTHQPETTTYQPETTTYQPETTTYQPETTTSQPETTTSDHYYEVTNYKTDDDEYNAKKSSKQYEPEFELKHHWNYPSSEETTTPSLKDNQTEMRSNKTGNKNKKHSQYPDKCQVLFDLWLRDSEQSVMSKVDWNVLPMTKISNTVHNISEIMKKKKIILNTFDVLSKIIKKFVRADTKGSGSLLRLFNESTTMKDLFKIVDASNIVQLPYNETTNEIEEQNIKNSSFDQMEKMAHTLMDANCSNKSHSHGQKQIRKTLTFTYSEEETIIDDSSSDE